MVYGVFLLSSSGDLSMLLIFLIVPGKYYSNLIQSLLYADGFEELLVYVGFSVSYPQGIKFTLHLSNY